MINIKKETINFGNNQTQSCPDNNIGYDVNNIFHFNNLDSNFSNATESYIIDDFTIFNPYRHNNLNIVRQT